MFKNSLFTALRGLKANKTFTVLNMLSLIIGLLVIYIAIGYLRFEKSYDSFHSQSDQIYRVGRTLRTQDYAVVGFPSWNDTEAKAQLNQIKGIEAVIGIEASAQFMISNDAEFVRLDQKQIEETALLTTNTPEAFTTIFNWEVLAGSLENFARLKNTLLLTASTASKLTSETSYDSLVNKTLSIGDQTYTVAAVIADVPQNSHFDFTIAAHQDRIAYWGRHLYVKLDPNTDAVAVTSRLNNAFLQIDPRLATNTTYKGHFLQKITDIHLNSNILYELKTPGNRTYMYLIGAFGVLIVLITLFNYANFTLALKTKQSKVIGVRKVLGASSTTIAIQFLLEALFLVLFSLPLLFLSLYLVVPFFNQFMGVQIASNPLEDMTTLGLLLVISFGIGLLASVAPAILLSGKDTLSLFKEKLTQRRFEHFSLRRYLVISQFAILIGVSSVSYFMYQQLEFINNKDLGFQKEGILYTYTSADDIDVFQQQLEAIPEIKAVGNGSSFGIETFNNVQYKLEGSETIFEDANQFYLDYDAITAYELETTLAPSIFASSENRKRRHLINRSAAERFANLKKITVNELIGTQIITEPSYQNEDGSYGFPFTIDGVYEDINAFSLKESIAPYFITVSDGVRMGGMSIVAFDPASTATTVAKIEAVAAKLSQSFPLRIDFLDDNFQQLHAQDTKTATLVFILNGIAILLAAIGIIGITLLLIVGRTREIGIRKVLGASVGQILGLSIKEYVKFVVVGLLISAPLAWWVTQTWLDNFAYRTNIEPLVFLVVALMVLLLAACIVSVVSYRSASANPVESLKTD
ncbi:MAG: FtsX-like permease family protein [Dokdonia sp.]|jgi:putative ABC transport system permease protein